jgi:hypothetical protein
MGLSAGTDKVTVELDGLVPVGQRTKVTHVPSGSKTCVGFLPGDASGNGTSNPQDIIHLIDCLNGVRVCGIWQCDSNRSNECNAQDILREIDLLNGADSYNPWNQETLPDCP